MLPGSLVLFELPPATPYGVVLAMPSLTFILLVLACFVTLLTLDRFRLQHDQLLSSSSPANRGYASLPALSTNGDVTDVKFTFPPQSDPSLHGTTVDLRQPKPFISWQPTAAAPSQPEQVAVREHTALKQPQQQQQQQQQSLRPQPPSADFHTVTLSSPPIQMLEPVRSTPTVTGDTSEHGNTNTVQQAGAKNAYVTLLSTSKERRRYIGYLSGIIVAQRSLRVAGSAADFVLLIAASPGVPRLPRGDEALLDRNQVTYRYVETDWAVKDVDGVMLAKIYCWKMTGYHRIVYMDSDVLPTTNMDFYFSLETTTGFAGGVSPLNGGFLVLSPSMSVFEGLRRLVVSRGPLQPGDKPPLDWDPDLGWGRLIGRQDRLDKYEKDGGKLATGSGWSFNAAWSDQGLLYYYFRFLEMEAGLNVVSRRLGQTKYKTLSYRGGSLLSSTPLGSAGFPELFAHFAGRVKPWNVCGARDEKTLVLAVKKKVKDPSKITREKGRAFWQWHSIYAQLDVDLSIDELSSLMTPGLRC